jgi:hypothetical protein
MHDRSYLPVCASLCMFQVENCRKEFYEICYEHYAKLCLRLSPNPAFSLLQSVITAWWTNELMRAILAPLPKCGDHSKYSSH